MADDIIARLRVNAEGAPTKNGGHIWLSLSPSTSAEAADLIEAQQAEIERLRAAGNELVAALKDARSAMCDYAHQGTGTDPESPMWEDFCMSTWEGVPDDLAAVDAAITAWEEARRG